MLQRHLPNQATAAFVCTNVPGTLKLREAMSKQLVKMVTAARPGLMAAAQAQLVTLRAELASMPPAVLGDAHAEMLRLIDDVSMTLQVSDLADVKNRVLQTCVWCKGLYAHL